MSTKALKIKVDPNSDPNQIQDINSNPTTAKILVNANGSGEIQFTVKFDKGLALVDIPESGLSTNTKEGYFPVSAIDSNTIENVICEEGVVKFATVNENTTISLVFKLYGKQGGLGNGTLYGKQGKLHSSIE